MSKKPITLGLFGFGCVGHGLYEVLESSPGLKAKIKKICIKHPEKSRSIPAEYFTPNRAEVLEDPEIDVIVELTDDPKAALEIVTQAMQNGKAVVTANKKMVADNLSGLYALQQRHGRPFLYEGACAASIPIIRNLEEYYDNDLLNGVEGILNGSTNYILSRIFHEGLSFETALKQAQELGFAETDPSLDIEGEDPKFKLCILLLHAFGLFVDPEHLFHFGIDRLNDFDLEFARKQGKKIKLVAKCTKQDREVVAYCAPKLVPANSPLNQVEDEYNGISVESVFAQNQFFVGKGAGGHPTGSAVLSDISALSYDYKYEYKKLRQGPVRRLSYDHDLKVYVRFGDVEEVNWADFDHIEERFESGQGSYVIGQLSLARLKEAKWLQNDEVNLLVL